MLELLLARLVNELETTKGLLLLRYDTETVV